jgi:hypothetical protein
MSIPNIDAETELEHAEQARQAGNEGRARVCARRAAGLAARDFLARQGVKIHDESAYTALLMLVDFPGLAPDLHLIAIHLTTKVTEAFSLPMDADLIAEARKLIGGLGERNK